MEWFKFYSSRWLSDLAIKQLSPVDRVIFVTLLCVTNVTDETEERNGRVTNFSEDAIISLTGLSQDVYNPDFCDVTNAEGFSLRFEKLGLIEFEDDSTIVIKSYKKRQTANLTNAERQKKWRDGKKVSSSNKVVTPRRNNSNTRVEKSRVEKSRVETQQGVSVVSDFDLFWNSYPSKKGKKVAEQKWNKLSKGDKDAIMADIPNRVENDDSWKRGFVPNPATYINQERWNDEITSNKANSKQIYAAD